MNSERDGGSEVTPQIDTFQGKLKMDSKIKVDRMQQSAAVASSAQTSTQVSKKKPSKTPSTVQPCDRTMAVPNLSPSVSVANSQSQTSKVKSATTIDALKSGGNILAEDAIDSDRSSICRSPGWDITERKKQKKTRQEAKKKLKREEERAATEAKRQRPQNRLTKPPPPSKGISKISSSMIPSESAPILSGPATGANDKIDPCEDRASSNAGSPRHTAWDSAKTPGGETGPSYVNEGFIGGVKLEQAAHATIQETIRQQQKATNDPRKSKFAEEFSVTDQDRRMSSNLPDGHASVPDRVQLHEEAYDQNTSSSRSSRKGAESVCEPKADLLSLEGKNKRGRRGWSSISSNAFQQASISLPQTTTGHETSRASESLRPRAEDNASRRSSKHSPSSNRPPVSYREPPQLAEIEQRGRSRRGSFSFLRIRQSSKDRSVTESQAKARAPDASSVTSIERPRPRRMSWSFGRSNKVSSSRTMTADSSNSEQISQRPLISTNGPPSESIEDDSLSARNCSKPIPLCDLRSATKAGSSSRRSHFPKLTSIPARLTPNEPLTAGAPRSTSDPPLTGNLPQIRTISSSKELSIPRHEATRNEDYSMDRTSSGKSDRGLSTGSQQSTTINNDTLKETSLQSTSSNGQSSSQSSSVHYSSDENYSIADEPPHASTLALSNLQSERSHSNAINDMASKTQATSQSNRYVDAANLAIGTTIQGNESAKTGLPRINTGSVNPSTSINPQDLDFLPTLKHQHLPRPVTVKSKNIPNKHSDPLLRNPAASLACPPPLTPPDSSSSASSSPPSPTNANNPPAQYLQTARQNLPPLASTSRLSIASPSTPGKNTLAKMFVVCCHCRYFHDMPSKIYECMAKPDDVVRDRALGVSGVVSMHVKCPWCGHGMSRGCCEGWAAVVVLRKRLH